MIRPFLIAITIFVFTHTLSAQFIPNRLDEGNQTTHVHSRDAGMIDGAQHPELIPDSTAYRLFFIAVSEEPISTPERAAKQLAFLTATGLEENDIQVAIPVLATFKTQYADLIKRYNENLEAPDLATFVRQRDELVQATMNVLGTVLTPDGLNNLHAHVEHEKRKMKIPKEVQ